MPLLKFDTEDEVIARANDTDAGLGGSVWTKDLARGERVASQLQDGNVWINQHAGMRPDTPFGGHKQSGIGSEFGVAGLRSFCIVQTITVLKA